MSHAHHISVTRRRFGTLAALLLTIVPPQVLIAQTALVPTSRPFLRTSPALHAAVIRRVTPGETLRVADGGQGQSGFRRVITTQEDTGWVLARYLAEPPHVLGIMLAAAPPAHAAGSVPANSPLRNTHGEVHFFHGCAPRGSGNIDRILNPLKNRVDRADPIDVSLDSVLHLPAPNLGNHDLQHRQSLSSSDSSKIAVYEGLPLRVEGFVALDHRSDPPFRGAKQEGKESPNCGLKEADRVDFHIWLTSQRDSSRKQAVVVEMTPRVRSDHPNWTVAKLRAISTRHLRVRVTGWLMFDQEHPRQLRDHPGQRQTRGTLWELHPVTDFLVEFPDADGWKSLDAWKP